MQLVIRFATVSDIPAMYSISRRAHQESYASLIPDTHRDAFRQLYTYSKRALKNYTSKVKPHILSRQWRIWVAEMDGKVVGYTMSHHVRKTFIQKRGLFVDPDWYGHGVGSALFEKSLEDAPKGCVIRLSVIDNNERAKRLYIKQGFMKIGTAPTDFFGAQLDIMERTIY